MDKVVCIIKGQACSFFCCHRYLNNLHAFKDRGQKEVHQKIAGIWNVKIATAKPLKWAFEALM